MLVIGGGPAGAFFAIQLLRRAAQLQRPIQVWILERRCRGAGSDQAGCALPDCWRGCNHCAGGISPRLNDSLRELGLALPDGIIQSRIRSVTIQGYWKNITLEVPPGRAMNSVYRGTRPSRRPDHREHFDGFLLQAARQAGAQVIGAEVIGVARQANGKPRVTYRHGQGEAAMEGDLVVFATGVNVRPGARAEDNPMVAAFRHLAPAFHPPRLRRALIVEVEQEAGAPPWLGEELHFVEYGSRDLPLEMCSLVPKRRFLTAVLVGRAVDTLPETEPARRMARQFFNLPQIRKLVPPRTRLRLACWCRPNLVVGTARQPFGLRVAAVGDLVTSRLYKDGLLSAHHLATALANAVLERGVDEESLRRGYAPEVERMRRDNRYAAVVFLAHRLVFSSSVLSRFLYQAVLTERKNRPQPRRVLEAVLWKVASGDDHYEQIFRAMIRPTVLASILWGGVVITFRNWLAELLLGLRWAGLGRFTTGVAFERLAAKRAVFASVLARVDLPVGSRFEFERMYTIKVRAPQARVFAVLGRFGEPDREYLHPRWVRIQRVAGAPNELGCTVEYRIVVPWLSFRLVLERVSPDQLAVYRVQNGFARGGVLMFELERAGDQSCDLSIYVAFNFRRGRAGLPAVGWWLLRHAFPAFIHDVIWNHSLCQLKDWVEERHQAGEVVVQDPDPPATPDGCHA